MKVLLLSLALVVAAVCEAPAPSPAIPRPGGRLLLLPARLEDPSTPTNTSQPSQSDSEESQPQRLLDSGEYYVLLQDGRLQMVKYRTAALTQETQQPQAQQPAQYTQPQAQQPFHYIQIQSEQQPSQYTQAQQAAQYTQPQAQQPVQFTQPQAQQGAQYTQPQAQQPAQYTQPQAQQSAQYNQPQAQPPAQYTQPQAQQSAQYTQPQAQQPVEPFAQFQVEYVQFPLPGSQFAQTKLQFTEKSQDKAQDKGDTEEVSGFEANVQYRDVKPISAPIYAYNPTPLVRILKK